MHFWSEEGGVKRTYPLREGTLLVGRDPACHIVIPAARVSKKHLQCLVDKGVVTVRDLGSANGTFVNGQRITSCVLNHGDAVILGGYRVVFDATEEAPAEAARPAFDFEPPGAPAPRGAPAAPPQTDLDEGEPAEGDTPVDGTFVPDVSAPQSLQPQVVARDGRMYLRDPRTSREVEIVPRGAGPQPDVSGYYAERDTAEKKRNTYLIVGAIAVAVLMIIALAFSTGGGGGPERPTAPKFPVTKYNALADGSIDLMLAGKFDAALRDLETADRGRPTFRVAATLRHIATEWRKSGKGDEGFNWLSVEPALRELRESRYATTKARTFARRRIDRIYDIRHQQAVAAQALEYRAAGEPEKALAEFAKLPADSRIRKRNEAEIQATVAACYEKYVALANEARAQGDWSAAEAGYTAAAEYADDRQKADLETTLRLVRKQERQEQLLDEANVGLRQNTVASLRNARQLLEGVADTGPLAARKADLRRRIDSRLAELETAARARAAKHHYDAGDGRKAIDIITQSKLTSLYPLRTRIERLETLLKDAAIAVEAGDYDLARERWMAATAEEPRPANAYHERAAERLAWLNDSRAKIAAEYSGMGDAALAEDDPVAAREMYRKALRWDPEKAAGQAGLDALRHHAQKLYNQALDHRYQGRRQKAVELFTRVLEYVDETDDIYRNARRHLAELEAESPEEDE